MTSIPLVDLSAQHAAVADEVAAGWQEVLARTAFIGGPQVAAFEREYAEFIGVSHCVAMANGTDSIEIALRALGIGHGDECILPANTFIATAEAVARAGATPVLVDCADDDTYLIDVDAVEAAVTSRTARDHSGTPLRPGRPGRATVAAGQAIRRAGSWRTRRSRRAPAATGRAPAPSEMSRPPASTRARTWEPTVTPGRRLPARPMLRHGCG